MVLWELPEKAHHGGSKRALLIRLYPGEGSKPMDECNQFVKKFAFSAPFNGGRLEGCRIEVEINRLIRLFGFGQTCCEAHHAGFPAFRQARLAGSGGPTRVNLDSQRSPDCGVERKRFPVESGVPGRAGY
jgi:hypothetical protein